MIGRCSRSRYEWRQRRRHIVPPVAVAKPLSPPRGSVLDDLPHVKRILVQSNEDAQRLVGEADVRGRRRRGIRVFFEAAEVALAWMSVPGNELPPSVHQPGNKEYLDIIKLKCHTLVTLGAAREVLVAHEDSGFFSAWVVVLDVLLMAPPEAAITVDWRPSGNEKHFCYHDPQNPDTNVWDALFKPVRRPSRAEEPRVTAWASELLAARARTHPSPIEKMDNTVFDARDRCMTVASRWNLLLSPRFRWLMAASSFAASQRASYHAVVRRFIRPRHPDIVAEVESRGSLGELLASTTCGGSGQTTGETGGVSVGVHKRVYTPGTAEYQGQGGFMLTCEGFVEATRVVISRSALPVTRLFLATDDEAAEEAFRRAFGPLLHVRRGVQRVGGGLNPDGTLNEVHIRSPHNPGSNLKDAADVVTDALLLARCATVVHMDSNVTSAVASLAPQCEMVHAADVLRSARGGQVPVEYVQRGYYSKTIT